MTGITWLHLSDWHEGRPAGAGCDRERVFQELIKDIKSRTSIDKRLETIDFIVFSGDVAFSGKQEQYEREQSEKVGLAKERSL
jgi:DNA repair exonuclease SbcCD nuclease subunit